MQTAYVNPWQNMEVIPAKQPVRINKRLFYWCALVVMKVILVGMFLTWLLRVVPKQGEIVLELGQEVPADVREVLRGSGWALERTSIDYGAVDTLRVGTYTAEVSTLLGKRAMTVRISDTTAPDLKTIPDGHVLQTGVPCGTDALVEEAKDLSGAVSVYFEENGVRQDTVRRDAAGTAELTLVAEDASGNRTVRPVSVLFDDAPRFLLALDRYVAAGTDADFTSYVAAWDDTDGTCNENISVDTTGLDMTVPGEYEIVLTATDRYGFANTKTVRVTVCADAKEVKQMEAGYVLPDGTMRELVGSGFFASGALQEENREEAIANTEPALLDIAWHYQGGRLLSFFGSGVIAAIDEDNIYILSVEHVIKGMYSGNAPRGTELRFFDGTIVYTAQRMPYVRLSDDNEIVLFRIPASEVPVATRLLLKEICFEEGAEEELEFGDALIAVSKYWRQQKDLVVDLKYEPGEKRMNHIRNTKGWNNVTDVVVTSKGVKGGMSGTAVIDERGRLIGLCSWSQWDSSVGENNYSAHCRVNRLNELLLRAGELD